LLSVFTDDRIAGPFDPFVARSLQDFSTMRHAFLLTAGVLSAALVGAATMLAASSAGAAPLIQAGTGQAELVHHNVAVRPY